LIKNYFKDSTRAQFEERQNDAETKLGELRVELEKLNKNINEEKKDDDEENDQQEDENLQETLARVKLEEQIMRVEEIVSLYKVKKKRILFFSKKYLRLGWSSFYGFNRTSQSTCCQFI
jgi:hypothetical protein